MAGRTERMGQAGRTRRGRRAARHQDAIVPDASALGVITEPHPVPGVPAAHEVDRPGGDSSITRVDFRLRALVHWPTILDNSTRTFVRTADVLKRTDGLSWHGADRRHREQGTFFYLGN